MGELECDTEVQIMGGEGRAVTGDSGSKAGQGRVFTGEKDEGHSEVGLSSSSICGLGTCATLLGEWRGVGGCSGEERTRAGQRSYIPSIPLATS